ncbi:glycosyltransferase family 2 protein [Candidatus Gottesmanbacteria bacterium]|nr:glycosyltransferase family 2 protein [Candidatus Gottesmanbacteria bacterium]
MKQENNVWCVVLTYYPKVPLVTTIIEAFYPIPVVVVDNTPKIKERSFVHAQTLVKGDNLGYTGGVNKGLQYAFKKGATWCIAVNDDISIPKSSAKTFIKKLRSMPMAIVGPYAGSLDKKRWTTVYSPRETPKRVDYISGSFMAIHKNVWRSVGPFYTPYFMYYEDVELCILARRNGFPLVHIPLNVSHSDTPSLGRGSYLHNYYLARNHMLFVERNAPWSVRVREYIRLPKTWWEHSERSNIGALAGMRDYIRRRFGRAPNGL